MVRCGCAYVSLLLTLASFLPSLGGFFELNRVDVFFSENFYSGAPKMEEFYADSKILIKFSNYKYCSKTLVTLGVTPVVTYCALSFYDFLQYLRGGTFRIVFHSLIHILLANQAYVPPEDTPLETIY